MTKRAAKISTSILLLFFFITGQVIVFAHTHKVTPQLHKHYAQKDKSKISEDSCPICVQHGNLQLFLQHHQFYFFALTSFCETGEYVPVYNSIEILLAGNRGPPVV
ncbi:hypothetical protein [uncultured Mucilaginibacter sp.]|uniref:hypothetical protein n=1 Tax=uncultured Mucilaginibacter sp. TaxID=797541 RepID=UPI0025F4295A|nr:hypothetical protein [uncultured Mucilaginibacter sp.]